MNKIVYDTLVSAIGLLAVLSGNAQALALEAMPPGDGANPEVSTNLPLVVRAERLGTVEFKLALDASPSNNVEFAIGLDADSDGDLSLEEADYTFGYDCGVWFVAETATGGVTETPALTQGRVERTITLGKRQFNAQWNIVKCIRRGGSTQNEVLIETPNYAYTLIAIR